jgi:hypothetical protein
VTVSQQIRSRSSGAQRRASSMKTAKNRIHIDSRVAAGRRVDQTLREQEIRAKVAELVAARTTAVRGDSFRRSVVGGWGPAAHILRAGR